MKRSIFVAVAAMVVCMAGTVFSADAAADAYEAFEKAASSIEEQIYAKQGEIAALYNDKQRNDEKAKQLFGEIGALEAQLYSARRDLRTKLEEAGVPTTGYGRHHGGYRPEMEMPRHYQGESYGHGGWGGHGGRHMGGGYGRHGMGW